MISLHRRLLNTRTQKGAVTLIITAMLLMTATLVVLFAAGYSVMQSKITGNQLRNQQAMTAAEAGLEFGINYLQKNSTTILASPSGGYIQAYTSASTTNVTLGNNSKFSIVYTNPIANNYTLIQITSTGISDDGTATRVVSQQVKFGSLLSSVPSTPAVIKGTLAMSGNSNITNTSSTATVVTGSTTSISGSAQTTLNTGVSSSAGNLKSDIQQNNSTLANESTSDFFATYFGASSNQVKSGFANYYSNSSDTNYNSLLNGKTGTTIWIDQSGGEATISGNTVIGSAANPVIIVVNGSLNLSGNATIYGLVFALGATSANTDITGNVSVNGALIAADNTRLAGNAGVTYGPSVLSAVQSSPAASYYAKIPGSWKDF